LHNYFNIEALGNCALNWIRFLQDASYLLVGKGIISSGNCCVVETVMTDENGALVGGSENVCGNNWLF
jgi:hypothetical protein